MKSYVLSIITLMICLCGPVDAVGCTSAIVGASAERQGRILLWKHRDSGHKDNVVERIDGNGEGLTYVALFNAEDTERREAWIGFNEAGFAVMNTASYNLAADTARLKDCEGLIMSMALRRCRCVDDFTALLDSLIGTGRPLGVQANFGVTDRRGSGMYVEASDHAYKAYPLESEPRGWMVRTNYSYSGGSENRLGEMRHQTAEMLMSRAAEEGTITPELIVEGFSRCFYHYGKGEDMLASSLGSMADVGELIVRRSSCASVVIATVPGGETEMWVTVGNPAVGVMRRVTLNDVPLSLQADPSTGRSPDCDAANRKRDHAWMRKGKRWVLNLERMRKFLSSK